MESLKQRKLLQVNKMNNKEEYQDNRFFNLKCIWMASRTVEYKLCDREFNCDDCQFDREVRNSDFNNEKTDINQRSIVDSLSDKLQNIKYDEKVIYLKNSLMIKQIFGNTFYLGLNPILQPFLEGVKFIKECELGKYILKGSPVLQFRGEWGEITLSSPMNFLMYDIMNNRSCDMLKNKWFAIVGIIQAEVSIGIITKKDWDETLYKSFEFVETIKTAPAAVGATMQDGGRQIRYLYELIGVSKFRELLNTILGM